MFDYNYVGGNSLFRTFPSELETPSFVAHPHDLVVQALGL